jgi:hypothetical protein
LSTTNHPITAKDAKNGKGRGKGKGKKGKS